MRLKKKRANYSIGDIVKRVPSAGYRLDAANEEEDVRWQTWNMTGTLMSHAIDVQFLINPPKKGPISQGVTLQSLFIPRGRHKYSQPHAGVSAHTCSWANLLG